jgi:hypothetical protein
MNSENLKEIFKQAAEIAESVPKDLREAAFNRALDTLLVSEKPRAAKSQKRVLRLKDTEIDGNTSDNIAILLADLDRTAHPEIATTPRVLERSLFFLRAVRDNHNIDGLGASQIAKVLTEKFRLKTTRQAVTQALDVAGNMVDRRITLGKVSYHLMLPGDEYLAAGNFISSIKPKKTLNAPNAEKKARITGRPGPGAMLKELVKSGFFAEHRSITDIQHHCENNLAHNYALNELSTPLRRAVHSGLLKREQNNDGQYEYIA